MLKTETNAYKVVTYHRKSLLESFLRYAAKTSGKKEEKKQMPNLIEDLKRKEVFKHYKKNSVVTSHRYSAGIFCFRSKGRAHSWAENFRNRIGSFRVIEVIGYDGPLYPKILNFRPNDWASYLLYPMRSDVTAPQETISFRKIKVIS